MSDWTITRLRRTAPAVAESVGTLRRAVVEFARAHGASDAVVADLQLAVSEACTNAVVHAYRDRDEPGELRVEAFAEPGRLAVSVSDDGDGMEPRPDSPGLGLGLPLIAQLADDLQITSDHGTCIVMNFPLDAGR